MREIPVEKRALQAQNVKDVHPVICDTWKIVFGCLGMTLALSSWAILIYVIAG